MAENTLQHMYMKVHTNHWSTDVLPFWKFFSLLLYSCYASYRDVYSLLDSNDV
jgi:hypothetical protein